jgi:hypothetical protein
MYIIILSIIWAFPANATISYLESHSRPSTSNRTFLAGEIHDADPAGHRQIVKNALWVYATRTQAPLQVYIEDPLAIPGLEQLSNPKGLLLGLVNELKHTDLPAHIQVHNLDTMKAANCAIHFFSQSQPRLATSCDLNELNFGHLLSELDQAKQAYATHSILDTLGATAEKDCNQQLATVTSSIELLEKNLTALQLTAGDSMAYATTSLAAKGISPISIYKPVYEADVRLVSLAAIVTTFESKTSTALLCGERHAKDVSRIIEYEQWNDLSGPHSFTSDWLLHAIRN